MLLPKFLHYISPAIQLQQHLQEVRRNAWIAIIAVIVIGFLYVIWQLATGNSGRIIHTVAAATLALIVIFGYYAVMTGYYSSRRYVADNVGNIISISSQRLNM